MGGGHSTHSAILTGDCIEGGEGGIGPIEGEKIRVKDKRRVNGARVGLCVRVGKGVSEGEVMWSNVGEGKH